MVIKKSGVLNIREEEGILRARILYEKKGKSYNVDIIDLLKGYDDKRISLRVVEVKQSENTQKNARLLEEGK